MLVGGDYQGKNAAIQNAGATYVSPEATIAADAKQSGDGGKVIVWGNDVARVYGTISARGGLVPQAATADSSRPPATTSM